MSSTADEDSKWDNGMETVPEGGERMAIVLRLKRIEGQLRGLQAMIEGGQDCERIAQQMSAARRALDKTFFVLVGCLVTGTEAERGKQVRSILARYG